MRRKIVAHSAILGLALFFLVQDDPYQGFLKGVYDSLASGRELIRTFLPISHTSKVITNQNVGFRMTFFGG